MNHQRLRPVRIRTQPRLVVVACWLTMGLIVTGSAQLGFAQVRLDTDQRRIDQYVQDGDFDRAEFLCRERLSNPKISLADRAKFTGELMRMFGQQAATLPNSERHFLWAKAQQLTASYLSADTESPHRFMIRLQYAELRRSKLWMRLVEGFATAADRSELREVTKQLTDLGSQLDAYLRSKRRDPNAPGRMSDKELRQLRARIQLASGRTLLTRAKAHPVRSEDRILAASSAAQTFQRLPPTSLTNQLWHASRIELLTALRLKGDWSAYTRELKTLSGMQVSAPTKAQIQAELLRAAVDRKNWKEVRRRVASNRALSPQPGEWQLAVLEGLLVLGEQATVAAGSADWQRQAVTLVDQSRNHASSLWLRRADALIAAAAASTKGVGAASQVKAQIAESLFRQGKLREAAAAFGEAADKALSDQRNAESLRLRMQAGAILIQAGELPSAVTMLRQAALAQPHESQAAQAHLLAIKTRLKIKTAEQGTTAEDSLVTYVELLDEHVQAWSGTSENQQPSTVDLVLVWRARYLEHTGKFDLALRDYNSVSDLSDHFVTALTGAERCYQQRSRQGIEVSDGVRYFQRIAEGWRNETRIGSVEPSDAVCNPIGPCRKCGVACHDAVAGAAIGTG